MLFIYAYLDNNLYKYSILPISECIYKYSLTWLFAVKLKHTSCKCDYPDHIFWQLLIVRSVRSTFHVDKWLAVSKNTPLPSCHTHPTLHFCADCAVRTTLLSLASRTPSIPLGPLFQGRVPECPQLWSALLLPNCFRVF